MNYCNTNNLKKNKCIVQELQDKHRFIQSNCIETQKELTQMKMNCKVLNQQTVNNNCSLPPAATKHYKEKVLKYIQTILFEQEKYNYNWDDLLELFEYKIKDCLLTVEAIDNFLKECNSNINAAAIGNIKII